MNTLVSVIFTLIIFKKYNISYLYKQQKVNDTKLIFFYILISVYFTSIIS